MAILTNRMIPEVRFSGGRVFLKVEQELEVNKSYYMGLIVGLTKAVLPYTSRQDLKAAYMLTVREYASMMPDFLIDQPLIEPTISREMSRSFVEFLFPELLYDRT